MSPVSRSDDSRKKVNQSAMIGVGLGLLPFRFAAPAVAALGMKVIKDVQESFEAETSPVEQAAAAAVLGAGEFALGSAARAARLMPWAGPVVSAVLTGAALKALGEGVIAYYQWARHSRDADARPADATGDGAARVNF